MFDHCLYFNTTALARRLEQEWALAFRPFDLTPPQGFLLRAILNNPGMAQHELAQRMAVSRPTATRALELLETKRLIERKASSEDGRELLVYPTSYARPLLKALNDASGAVTRRLQRILGEDEFIGTVSKVRTARLAMA